MRRTIKRLDAVQIDGRELTARIKEKRAEIPSLFVKSKSSSCPILLTADPQKRQEFFSLCQDPDSRVFYELSDESSALLGPATSASDHYCSAVPYFSHSKHFASFCNCCFTRSLFTVPMYCHYLRKEMLYPPPEDYLVGSYFRLIENTKSSDSVLSGFVLANKNEKN